MRPPVPDNEVDRLAELHELGVLDTLPEQHYDDIVQLAAALCDTPIAIINFVDAERQWGKALIGLESSEAPRHASFCARTIVADDGVVVVPDTHKDPTFVHNPQVTGEPRLRFYAGVSVISPRGHALGSVCVADRQPRELPASAIEGLRVLARQTAALLELRMATKRLAEANDALAHLATRDDLTGLPNRRLMQELLERQLRSHQRSGRALGVVFADLDRLKAVNDAHGHGAGDDVLRTVAGRLQTAARTSDTVGRISGDEFVVVCPDLTDPRDIERVARRLSLAVSVPTRVGDAVVTPRLTVGTAVAAEDDDVESIIARADREMYAAKRPG